ncbi:hypothetical protein AGMMS50276_05490 [Synergistales bacterium]|nr:hypothetical protein AGMMS50276_05490 [Synergistales bacterium]
MNKKVLMSIIVLTVATMFAVAAFAAGTTVVSSEGYVLKTNGNGIFWIDDNVNNRTVPIRIRSLPVIESGKPKIGYYELVCGSTTRVIVNSVADVAALLTNVSLPAKVAIVLGKHVYNGLCDYYEKP